MAGEGGGGEETIFGGGEGEGEEIGGCVGVGGGDDGGFGGDATVGGEEALALGGCAGDGFGGEGEEALGCSGVLVVGGGEETFGGCCSGFFGWEPFGVGAAGF